MRLRPARDPCLGEGITVWTNSALKVAQKGLEVLKAVIAVGSVRHCVVSLVAQLEEVLARTRLASVFPSTHVMSSNLIVLFH